MKMGVDYMKFLTNELHCRIYDNDMVMIHTGIPYYLDYYDIRNLKKVLSAVFVENGSLSLEQICKCIKVNSVMLAKLLVDEMVTNGLLCVDESDLDILYYDNLILSSV